MGNNDSKTEIKEGDSTEGSSVDPVSKTKIAPNGDFSRDVMPTEESALENKIETMKLCSGHQFLKNVNVDEVSQNHTSDSKADDIDGHNPNHDEETSSVSSSSQVVDVLQEENGTEVIPADKEGDARETDLSKNDILESNDQNTSEDLDRNSDSKTESYNSEEVCPIIDDLDFRSEESDTQCSDDNEVSEKDLSVISDDKDVSSKETNTSGGDKVSKIETGACSDEHELLNREASNKSEELNRETKKEIQKQVERCVRSMEQLERDHRDILDLVNKRSESQRELNRDGLSVIGELERIVENFTQRRKEKDEAIQHLKTILSKLTENLSVIEQEIHSLQSSKSEEFPRGDKDVKNSEVRKEEKRLVTPQTTKVNEEDESEKQDWSKTVKTRQHDNKEGVHQSSREQGSSEENTKFDGNYVSNSRSIPLTNPETQSSSQEPNKDMKINCQRVPENNLSENVFESRQEKQGSKSVSEGIPQERGNSMNANVVQSNSGQSSGVSQEETKNNRNVVQSNSGQSSGVSQEETKNNRNVSQSNSGQSSGVSQEETKNNRNVSQIHSVQATGSVSRQQEQEKRMNPNIVVESKSQQSDNSDVRRQEEMTNQSNIPDRVNKTNFSTPISKQRETLNPGYWVDRANEILRMSAIEGPADNVCGPNTVLCLDTSDSMWGNPFRTMINLALRFLSGLESNDSVSEKVGLVCFGAETKVISRCCLDYPRLKQEISKLRPGGHSPLTAGLMLSLPLTMRGKLTIPQMDGVLFFPRVIVITDGVATPELVTTSDDFVPDLSELMMINTDITIMARRFKERGNRVYCVPVGQANEAIISPLVEATSGKIVQPANFEKLIHQFHTEFIAAALRRNFPDYRTADPYMIRAAAEATVSSQNNLDMDDVVEYVRNPPPQRGLGDDDDDDDENAVPNEGSSNMPPIGTRVRRGPDWSPEFIGQDGDGPGTIVEHNRGGFIRVMWDNGHLNVYPYGASGRFAVIVVDEPRILQQHQFIEVGCLVRRGDNWRDDDEDGGPGNIGVVFRVHSDGTVGVRWPTGRKRRYKYGRQGFFEVEICDPFDEEVRFRMLSMNFQWQEGHEEKRTKSKPQVTTEDQPRIEDIVNSDERDKNNNRTLEEMNKRNALRSKRIEDQLETDSAPLSVEKDSKSAGTNRESEAPLSVEKGSKSGGTNRESETVDVQQEQCEELSGASAIQPISASEGTSEDSKTNSGVLIQPMPESKSGQEQEKSQSAGDKIRKAESAMKCEIHSTKPVIQSSSSLEVDGENSPDFVAKTEGKQERVTIEPADEEPVEDSERLNLSCSSSSDKSSNSDTTSGSDVSSGVQDVNQTPSPSCSTDEITVSTKASPNSGHDAEPVLKTPVAVVWQVHDRYDGWTDFPEEVSSRLEKVYQKNPQATCSYMKNKRRFQVQLSKMIHIHPVTKEISNVKRNVTNA
ncbi:uncharacterized protein LOC134243034 isoform X2 [Saccostrea cucullata]|uniref:uncharacterized protein LOC134243034 isoform X2 n=1 Tax=Saccostrea cuccullata TaxID=36930 RepID=UPI002ED130C9